MVDMSVVLAARGVEGRSWLSTGLTLQDRTYKRNSDGEFASGGGGDSGDGEESGYDPGDEFGNAELPDAYHQKYGDVIQEARLGENNQFAVVRTDTGAFHIAADGPGAGADGESGDRSQRQVLQDLTTSKAKTLGDDVWAVHAEGATEKTHNGITVRPDGAGDSGRRGVEVTWSSGKTSSMDERTAGDLADVLNDGFTPPKNDVVSVPRAELLLADMKRLSPTSRM